ncbi:MAG: NUDIX domain-containing protein [Candidatus Magnetominusculus sp. LBB02]|nr:NUDIX domain-containing protein [Candidatus Magnetominusculus sp. LBB02]
MSSEGAELLDIVNPEGQVIGQARRNEVHGNNKLLHRVVHVFVFNPEGKLLLQKRSMKKDVAPGVWDTSVGGHVDLGETIEAAVLREMSEELGVTLPVPEYSSEGPPCSCTQPRFMYKYIHSNQIESELVHSYSYIHNADVVFNTDEIDEVRYWDLNEIKETLGKGILSDNFEHEFANYLSLSKS